VVAREELDRDTLARSRVTGVDADVWFEIAPQIVAKNNAEEEYGDGYEDVSPGDKDESEAAPAPTLVERRVGLDAGARAVVARQARYEKLTAAKATQCEGIVDELAEHALVRASR
jgi:hypothetical protein